MTKAFVDADFAVGKMDRAMLVQTLKAVPHQIAVIKGRQLMLTVIMDVRAVVIMDIMDLPVVKRKNAHRNIALVMVKRVEWFQTVVIAIVTMGGWETIVKRKTKSKLISPLICLWLHSKLKSRTFYRAMLTQ
jgi:hypothetical protein